MKETINVSIAGIAFILDKECYVMLSNFLTQSRLSLQDNASAAQIISDVEVRIAEQILSVQDAGKPVSMPLLRPIIEQLGGNVTPLVAEPAMQSNTNQTLSKRLFRNPKGAILGGVCSGMATYFNMDVVVFRILFLLPLFFSGIFMSWLHNGIGGFSSSINATLFFLYIILWIVIPKAKTPREKLEMQGEQITIDSMAQYNNATMECSSSSTGNAGRTIASILKILAVIMGIMLFVGAIVGTIISLGIVSYEMSYKWTPIPEFLSIVKLTYTEAALWCSAIVLVPVFAICYLIMSSVFTFWGRKVVPISLMIIWLIMVIAAVVLMIVHMNEIVTISRGAIDYW